MNDSIRRKRDDSLFVRTLLLQRTRRPCNQVKNIIDPPPCLLLLLLLRTPEKLCITPYLLDAGLAAHGCVHNAQQRAASFLAECGHAWRPARIRRIATGYRSERGTSAENRIISARCHGYARRSYILLPGFALSLAPFCLVLTLPSA